MIDTPSPYSRDQIARRCAAFARVAEGPPLADLKHAAVAITLVDDSDGIAMLLTMRTTSLRGHSGQWALPGGRCDPNETPIDGALRELHEELGLRCDAADVLGLLDDYPTRSGYLITPVVVWAGANARITPNPDEVASVHRIPLDAIARLEAFDFVTIPESERRVIRYRHNDNYIHAPTAALIYQFREVIAGRKTRVADLEQPVFAWR